jgi:hypothetical protein
MFHLYVFAMNTDIAREPSAEIVQAEMPALVDSLPC